MTVDDGMARDRQGQMGHGIGGRWDNISYVWLIVTLGRNGFVLFLSQ
jgi:hypothetical protein